MNCPRCAGERVVRNGRSRHGRQRLRGRRGGGRTFTPAGEEDRRRRIAPATKEHCLKLYLEGLGFRAI